MLSSLHQTPKITPKNKQVVDTESNADTYPLYISAFHLSLTELVYRILHELCMIRVWDLCTVLLVSMLL